MMLELVERDRSTKHAGHRPYLRYPDTPDLHLAGAAPAVDLDRIVGIRQLVAPRPLRADGSPRGAVPRGVDAPQRAGYGDRARPSRRAGQQQHVSPPGNAREAGRHGRPRLERPAGTWD